MFDMFVECVMRGGIEREWKFFCVLRDCVDGRSDGMGWVVIKDERLEGFDVDEVGGGENGLNQAWN
jgi:hypothetical protein